MHYHIDTDTPKQERWARAKEQYSDIMRNPDNINFITLFREPRDRLLSFYTFFIEFETLVRAQTRAVHTGLKAVQTATLVCPGRRSQNWRVPTRCCFLSAVCPPVVCVHAPTVA